MTFSGDTPVTTGQALTSAQLQDLQFTPTQGLSNQGSTFTYAVTDGAGNASQGTAALNIGSAGAPTISGTHATADQAEAPGAGPPGAITSTTFVLTDQSSAGTSVVDSRTTVADTTTPITTPPTSAPNAVSLLPYPGQFTVGWRV